MSMRIRVLLRAVLLAAMAAASTAAYCATVTWDGGGGNQNWSVADNWSTNALPGVSDDVVIPNGVGTIGVDFDQTVNSITIHSGSGVFINHTKTLTVNGATTVDSGSSLFVHSSTFTGNGTLTVNGFLEIHAGTVSGSGALNVNSGGLVWVFAQIYSASVISRVTTNDGTIVYKDGGASGTNFPFVFSGATLTNTGLIDIQTAHDIDSGGSPILDNNAGGEIRMSGSGTTELNLAVNNAAGATIDVQSGNIALNGGGTDSGEYAIASSSILSLTGTFTMSGSPTVTGGGTFLIDDAATLIVGPGVDVTVPNLSFESGTITGAGDLHVSDSFEWSGGTISGSGQRVLESTVTMSEISCSTGNCLLDGATLQLHVSTTYSASGNALALSNGASLTIATSKAFAIINDGNLTNGGGAASSIIDNGKIWKRITAGTSTIGVPVTLSGTSTVEIDAGTLRFAGGATVGGAGATFEIDPGMTLEVTGGVFDFNSASVFFPFDGDVKVSSGILRVSTPTLTIPNLTLQGGIIDGAGDLHVSGDFNWLGGTLLGLGERVLDPSSTPIISCTAVTHCNIDGATLRMNASGTFNATTHSLVFFNGANFIIASGKTLNITTDGTIVGAGGTITNNGTITKSGGTGIRSIGTPLNNNGSVIVTLGGLSLLGNGTHSGSFTTTAPGEILFDGGTHTISGGISGDGSLAINGATVTLNSAGNAGGFTMSGGTLGGSGTLTLSNGGTWSGGTMSGSGTTAVAGGKNLTVSGLSTLNGRTLNLDANAMLELTSQRLEVSSAANVTGDGTVRVNGGTLRVLTGVTQTIPKLTLTSGVVDGVGDLHVSSNFNWLGGTIAGSGEKVLESTVTLQQISCSTSNCLLDGATLRLQAWGEYTASSNALVLSNGASLKLDDGKVLFVNNDGDFLNGGGAPSTITVGGRVSGTNSCIQKRDTAGTSVIAVPVMLSGSLMTETGTMQLSAGVTVTGTEAIVHYDVGTTIEITGGVFLFNTGTVSFPAAGDFKVSGGTLRVPTGITLTTRNLTLEGSGVVDGGGTLILNGTNTWASGTMGSATEPGGITRINSGHVLNVTAAGTPTLTQSRILRNGGTLNLPAGGGISLSGSGTIENNGTIAKNTSGTSTIQPRVETSSGAAVNAATGTIAFSGGGIAAGVYSISPGATLALTGGTFTAAGTATVTGDGTLSIAGATLDADTGADLTIPRLDLSAGTITGAGAVRMSGPFHWSGGAIAGSGPRVMKSTSTPTISCSGSDCVLDGAALQLQAFGTYNASTNALVLSNGASLVLDPGKTLNVTNDGDFESGGGAASSIVIGGFAAGFNGCIWKTATPGTTVINVPVVMEGSFLVETGTLQVAAGVDVVTASAIVDYRPGTTIEVTGGMFVFNFSGVSFPFNGNFKVSAGTLRVPTGVTITMPNVTLEGSGVIDGGGTLNLSGASTWSAGTMSGSGTTVVPATKTLGISAPVTLSRTLQNNGTLNVSGTITGSGTIDNNGTLNALADLTIGTVLNNSGQVDTSHALSLAGGGMHSGSFDVTAPGSLFFSSGMHSISGGSINGSVEVTGGMAVFTSGAVSFPAGDLKIGAGTLRVEDGVTLAIPNVTLQGSGVIDGGGTLILSGTSTWEGGAMGSAAEPGGVTEIGSGSTLDITNDASQSLTHGRELRNGGTINYTGTSTLTLSGAAKIANSGTFNLTVDGGINVSGSGTIDNAGTLEKTLGAGTSTLFPAVNNAGTMIASSGTLALAGDGTHTGTFTANAGSFAFPSGTHSMTGGSIGGIGALAISGATVTVNSSFAIGPLSLTAGSFTLDAGGSAGTFTMSGGTLGGSGTLTLTNGGTWSGGTMIGTGTTINDAASLSISAPVTLDRTLQNDDTLNVSGNVTGSGTIDNNGTLNAAADLTIGTVLNNSGQVDTSHALSLAGGGTHSGSFDVTGPGIVSFSAGTHSISGGSINGSVEVTGGMLVFTSGAVSFPAGDFKVSAGTLRVPASVTVAIPNATLEGSGVIDGGGTLILSGTWEGGTMGSAAAPGGITQVDSGLTVTPVVPVSLTQTRQLVNNGTLSYGSVGANILTMSGDSKITNNGTLNCHDGTIGLSGNALIENNGSITKVIGTGTTAFMPPVDNNSGGTVSAAFAGGTVALSGGGIAAGAYAISSGATLALAGGTFPAASTATVTGAGTLSIDGATLRVPAGISMSAPNVTLQGSGVIDGGGTLTLSGTSTWAGGTMGSATAPGGVTRIDSGSTLTVSAPVSLDSRTLQNAGTLNVSGNITGSGTIDNGNTLNALADLTIGAVLNNGGSVVTSNALSLAGNGTHSGSFDVTMPGSLTFSAGTHSLSGGSIGGTGTLDLSGATVTVNSPFTIGALNVTAGTATLDAGGSAGTFTMSGGTLGGSGTLTLTNGGTWSGGTMTGTGTTINDAATLDISAPVTLDRTLQNDDTLSVSADLTGSGTIVNNDTLDIDANVTIATALNNNGAVTISSGLSLTGNGTHTGSFHLMPGDLSFSSGTHSLSGVGSIDGTGTLSFSGAAATVAVPVDVGALSVTAGTATLDADGSADMFTMSGGTLGGSGTLTLNGGGTWSGGTMSGTGTTRNSAAQTLSIPSPVTLDSRTLQNDGALTVSGNITGSGTIVNDGTLETDANVTIATALNNNDTITANNALSLTGNGTHTGSFHLTPGNLSFASGTHSLSGGGGSIDGTGTLSFNGATATIGVPVDVGALSVTAGTATLDANASADDFTMTGGTLGGSGTLTLNGGGDWSGGTMSGSGTTVNPAAMTLSISAPVTLDRTLQNNGTLNVSADITGSGTIDNGNTLSPAADVAIGPALNNSGQIATSTLLSLGGNGTHSGTFTANAPGVIDFSGGTQTISGTLNGTGTLRFSGAAATVTGTWSGMPVEVTGGSVALDTDGTIPALTLSGGTLTGDGDVTVSGPSTWSGGTIAGGGAFTFDTGATVEMPGTNVATLARPLRNEGTIHYTAATNGMLIAGVEVRNNGTVDLQSTQGIAATAGTPPFVNFGTLQKSGGSGALQFDAPLSNRGLMRVELGTMQFGGTYTQSAGKTSIASGATLETDTVSLDGGSLGGNGTVAATVANNATVSPGASPGTLTIDGDYVQSPDGVLDIQLGGTAPGTQYDRLLVTGSVTLDGTLNVTTANGFLAAPGNAFEILTFGSRVGGSTFAVTNGLASSGATLTPTFTATALQLRANQLPVADVAAAVTGPSSTIAGTQVIYTLTVSNLGPDTATNVSVTATASPGLALRGISGACTGSFPCTIAALSPGQSATIQTAWDIASSATGSVQLTVNAGAAADANPSNNTAAAITSIGDCPAVTIAAPREMTSGATAAASATPFSGATYHWTIVNGTIDSDDDAAGIAFTAGETGTTRLTVTVTGNGCSLGAAFDVKVTPRLECVGTAIPTAPADDTTTDAVVDFAWTAVDGASGYRLWLQQGDAPPRSLGTTLDTSRTKIILPGTYQWYVETLFDGCASHESERRTMTILPGEDCGERRAPQLGAPANETPAASAAVAFSWTAVDQALEYELWLAPAGGVPTLIRTTSDTATTAVVPPGRLEWYVRAIFAGCPATESAHRVFTYRPPPQCASPRPLLIAPVEKERLTSPVSFEWTSVPGATSYELYLDGVLAATSDSPQVSGIALPRGERRWHVRAHLGEGCGALDSAESRFIVVPTPPGCSPLGAPVLSAPARVSSAVAGRIQWSAVAGATAYVVETSGDPRFPRPSTSSTLVTARQLPFTFTNTGTAPIARYVRVHAVDRNCVEPVTGPFSPVAVLFVLPATSSDGVAQLTDPTDVPYTLDIPAELAGRGFTATPTVPWISVAPMSGIVPPGGQTLHAIAHTAGLAPGTNTGRVDITTTEADVFTPLPASPVKLNLIPGVVTAPKNTPPPDALIIPAVASVTNFIVRYHSDISVTNTSAQVMSYEIDFVPSGPAGLSEGQKTNVSLEPGATMALSDIVATWFGGRTSTGTLEIRPLTEVDTSTSSAPVDGLANRITFASSRTFSTTAAGGTYGQYVPAVPYANFIAKGSTLSLQHVAQSDYFRTNLGLVEGSGDKVSVEVRIFDAAGTKLAAFPVNLNGGERAQLNGVLSEHGVTLDDGRIEVEVMSGDGKVTAYASVVDNATNDPQLVPPVNLDQTGRSKWVIPGVADLVSGSGNWQTDVRIFNAGAEPADLTLAFHSMNGGAPTTRTITLAPREVRQLDRVLSFFDLSGNAGALHITSAAPAPIVTTARTYLQTDDGAYGQFITAVSPDEAVSVGSRPLQILQMEESDRFKSNIGFAEVSGNPVTLEVAVFRPNSTDPTLLEVKLEPNQFRQLTSLLASLGLGELYNARISVRAVGGEGRAVAYGSLIDHKTGDPTYIPGQ